MKNYIVKAGKVTCPINATTRRTALAGAMLEMIRSGKVRLLDFDAETVARWSVQEVK